MMSDRIFQTLHKQRKEMDLIERLRRAAFPQGIRHRRNNDDPAGRLPISYLRSILRAEKRQRTRQRGQPQQSVWFSLKIPLRMQSIPGKDMDPVFRNLPPDAVDEKIDVPGNRHHDFHVTGMAFRRIIRMISRFRLKPLIAGNIVVKNSMTPIRRWLRIPFQSDQSLFRTAEFRSVSAQ